MIPYGHQDINEADIQAVVSVLNSDFLTQGPTVSAFEKVVAAYCGTSYGIAVNSGVGKGDWVWTSPITFVASANCALYCGAQLDFVDINPRTYNLSVERLAEKLAQADRKGRLPKVVIPVHLCGQCCDMAGIYALSRRYGFKIIEDASHAIGGKYEGQPIGNTRYSDITIFSFHPVKIITTAEGGMALTNNVLLAKRMQLLRNHGITRDASDMTHMPDGPWYYQQIDLGFNYRMTDLQAALGLSQMQRLEEFVKKRHAIAERYDVLLADLPVITPWQHPSTYSALHLYVIRLKLRETNKNHREIFEALRLAGIGVNVHYIPVYRQPYYERMGFEAGYCPEAECYYNEAISLPMYPGLIEQQQRQVVTALKEVVCR